MKHYAKDRIPGSTDNNLLLDSLRRSQLCMLAARVW